MTKLLDLIRRGETAKAIELITNGDLSSKIWSYCGAAANYHINGFNEDGISALQFATYFCYEEIVRALLAHGADVNGLNKTGEPVLFTLAMVHAHDHYPYIRQQGVPRKSKDIKKILRIYIEHGVNINAVCKASGRTSLHHASGGITGCGRADIDNDNKMAPNLFSVDGGGSGHITVVRALLAYQAAVNHIDKYGQTPLFFAANTRGNAPIVQLLLANGADINARDNFKNTALHFAVNGGCVDTVNELIKNNADLNVINEDGLTPLLLAVRYDNHENLTSEREILKERIALALINANANLDVQDRKGRTALHWASDANRVLLMRKLLDANANPKIADKSGKLPLMKKLDAPLPKIIEYKHIAYFWPFKLCVYITPAGQIVLVDGHGESIPYVAEEYYNREYDNYGDLVPAASYTPGYLEKHNVKFDKIATHTASIHSSVSESALLLHHRYQPRWFETTLLGDPINQLLNDISKVEQLQKLILAAEQYAHTPDCVSIVSMVRNAVTHVSNSTYADPVSKIKLCDLQQLLLIGISRLQQKDQRDDAILKLCEHLYFAEAEYKCYAGYFNNLVYSQNSILPEITVVVQTKELASNDLLHRMNEFAKHVIETADFNSETEFETALLNLADSKQCLNIATGVFSEYYLVFGLASKKHINNISEDRMNFEFKRIFGVQIKNMFELFNIAETFKNMHKIKITNNSGSNKRLKPQV